MALTKVTGQVIKNTTDVTVGVLTVTNTLAVGGTVSIGGTLTYEDVTNVDAVGLITARNGIVVGSGITLSKDGDVFFTGIATGNGSGLTALNASNLGSGTVPTARLGSGTASSSTFLRGDSSFQTITTDLVGDTSPQLGGNLDVNTKNIVFGDSGSASDDRLTFGAGTDLSIYHDGTHTYLNNITGNLRIQNNGTVKSAQFEVDQVDFNDSANSAVQVRKEPAGNFKIFKNLSVAGVTTVTGIAQFENTINLTHASAGQNYIYFNEDLQLAKNGTGTRLKIDSDGRVLIGQTSSVNGIYGSPPPRFSVSTTTASPAIFATYSNDVYGSRVDLIKSRATTVGGTTVVQAGDALGEIIFGGADGDQFHPSALIQSTVESGVGNNDMPGDLRFYTNAGATTATERVRIISNGRVHIRPSNTFYAMNSNSTDLVIGDGGGGRGMTIWTAAAADNQTISFQTNETLNRAEGEISYGPTATSVTNDRNAMMFRTNSAERFRIDSSGRLLLGTTTSNSPTGSLHVKNAYIRIQAANQTSSDFSQEVGVEWSQESGSDVQVGKIVMRRDAWGGAPHNMDFYTRTYSNQVQRAFILTHNQNATLTGSLTQNASDIRLKENIQPITNALEKVNSLSGFTFNWNQKGKDLGFIGSGHDEVQVGLSAQDVEKIQSEVVKPAPVNDEYKTIQYEKLVPLLVESIKELSAEVAALKSQLNN